MSHRKLEELVALSQRLLAPGGCPWDREQTPKTLKPFVLEEACEVNEAIDSGDTDHIREELGDLLFQVVFLTNLHPEFTIEDVIQGISEKLIRRHPHVFQPEEVQVTGSKEVLKNWERIKMEEKAKKRVSVLEGVPIGLPGLSRAQRLTEKAARVGFDWENASQVVAKLEEELEELDVEMKAPQQDRARLEDELGDVLFVMANLARKLGLDAEGALAGANRKFTRRFQSIEQRVKAQGRKLGDLPLTELDAIWNQVKEEER